MDFDYNSEKSDEKIKLNIYDESLSDSLFDDDTDWIILEIKKPEYTVEVTMQEFAEAVMAGRYFTCGVYGDDWKEQQIIALDFDNDKDRYPQITIKKAVSILKNVGIKCCFVYHTDKHQKDYTEYGLDYPARDRFRIILLSDEVITDYKKCRRIIDGLLSLFKQHSMECNDLERVLYDTSESAGLYMNKVYNRTFDHKIALDLYEKNIQQKKDKKKALSNILNASSNSRSLSLQVDDNVFNMDVNTQYKDLPYIQITFAKNGDEILKLKHAEFLKFWKKKVHYFFVKDKSYEDTHIYVYNNGVYKLRDETEIKTLIFRLLPDVLKKSSNLSELYKMLQYDDTKYVQQSKLNPERYINFQNGLYDLVTGKIEVHGPDVLSTIQLPIEYIPNHDFLSQYYGGTFDTYMNHFLGSDKSQIQLMLEFLGMALSNVQAHRLKKALLIIGPGDTGKSQLLRLVELLLGTENTYFCSLNKLEKNRFEIANLYGKRLGGTADMGFAKISELEVFKQLTGGDGVSAEYKGRKGFNFIYNGLLWFCSNRYPLFGGDIGDHVYNRFTIIRAVGKTYKKGSQPIDGAVEQDKLLLDKLYNERHYIVYLAIKALTTALVNEKYSETDKQRQELLRFKKSNSSLSAFFEDCVCKRIDRVLSDNCTKPMLFNIYKQWVRDNYDIQKPNRNEFYSFIESQGGEESIKDGYKYYSNFTLKAETKEQYKNIYGEDSSEYKEKYQSYLKQTGKKKQGNRDMVEPETAIE